MDTLELIRLSQSGDKKARDTLVTENVGLVWSIVKRFTNRGHELEDLFQIGSIGLIKAIDKFDISFDVKFSTYAVPMITGEIKRFLRDDSMIKVSRSLKEIAAKVKLARDNFISNNEKEPTIQELSKITGVDAEEIIMALEASAEIESLNKTIYQGDGNQIYLADKLQDKEDDTEKLLNHMLMEQLLASLNDSERELIKLRYFQDKTQTQVAKKLGVSQVQVSRLEKKILMKMREGVNI